jgi:hypothetical protein
MLDRLSRALDADIAIFDTKGHLVQGAGEPIPAPDDDAVQRIRPRYRAFNAVLPDGSHMVAYVRKPFSPPRHNLIFTFLLIATAVGIVAYPVVRNLTKRLDALRQSMQDWGHGNLQPPSPPPSTRPPTGSKRWSSRRKACSPMPAMNCGRRSPACGWRPKCSP